VQRAGGREAALLEERERDAPGALLDLLPAVAALRAARGVALGARDARDARVLDALSSDGLEPLLVGDGRLRGAERLEERVGPLHRAALEVRPLERLALGKGVRQALPELQLAGGDFLAAAAALGAARRCGLDHVGHGYSSRRRTKHFK
jgi:hypothetical protein